MLSSICKHETPSHVSQSSEVALCTLHPQSYHWGTRSFTTIWCNFQPITEARAMIVLMEVYLETGAKRLLIIHSLFMRKSICHKSHFVLLDATICWMLDLIDSLGSHHRLLMSLSELISHTSFFMMDWYSSTMESSQRCWHVTSLASHSVTEEKNHTSVLLIGYLLCHYGKS